MVSRLEVRLDSECRGRLDELAQRQGVSASEVVRGLINGAYESVLLERRLQAVEELTRLEAETPPDPDQLAMELGAAHETSGLP